MNVCQQQQQSNSSSSDLKYNPNNSSVSDELKRQLLTTEDFLQLTSGENNLNNSMQ
jgi:hypothetical protein